MATIVTPPPRLASAKVLETYETLEPILLHLPLRTLLLSQRVNKAFEDVIKRSKNIRQALFLEPSSVGPIVVEARDQAYKNCDPFESWTPSHLRTCKTGEHWTEWRSEESKKVVISLLNPFFASTKEALTRARLKGGRWSLCNNWARRDVGVEGALRVHTLYELQGTEAKMLLTQPPARSICYDDFLNPELAVFPQEDSVEGPSNGITAKSIIDLARTYGSRTAHSEEDLLYFYKTDGSRYLGRTIDQITG